MRAIKDEDDVEQLQTDLDKLYKWQENNNMLFNGNKFEVLRYGNNTDLKNSTAYFTPDYEDVIEEKDTLRDLGIMITNDGKFSSHVEHVCSKVKQKSGWITRTFQCRKTWFMKFMWKTLVQCHIDYKIIRIYTRKIPEVKNLNYWQRLKELKMLSQERRAERYKAIYVWKILEKIVPNCGLVTITSERRGREVQIPHLKGSGKVRNLRENGFQVSGAKVFNSLPKHLRMLSNISVDDFKCKLDKYLEAIPDEPALPEYTPSACNLVTAKPSNSIVDQGRTILRRPG